MEKLVNYLRNFPHQGGIIVNEEKKFIYMKPCKTAGTSILRYSLENKIQGIFHYKDHKVDYINWLNGLDEKKISKYFIFSIVRNPYDRIISCCSHFGISLDYFIHHYKNNSLKKIVFEHSLPLTKYNYYENLKFTKFTGRFENLEIDYSKICKILNIKKHILPHTNRSNRSAYQNYYNNSQINEISKIYKEDLENFNYSF